MSYLCFKSRQRTFMLRVSWGQFKILKFEPCQLARSQHAVDAPWRTPPWPTSPPAIFPAVTARHSVRVLCLTPVRTSWSSPCRGWRRGTAGTHARVLAHAWTGSTATTRRSPTSDQWTPVPEWLSMMCATTLRTSWLTSPWIPALGGAARALMAHGSSTPAITAASRRPATSHVATTCHHAQQHRSTSSSPCAIKRALVLCISSLPRSCRHPRRRTFGHRRGQPSPEPPRSACHHH